MLFNQPHDSKCFVDFTSRKVLFLLWNIWNWPEIEEMFVLSCFSFVNKMVHFVASAVIKIQSRTANKMMIFFELQILSYFAYDFHFFKWHLRWNAKWIRKQKLLVQTLNNNQSLICTSCNKNRHKNRYWGGGVSGGKLCSLVAAWDWYWE